MSRALDGFFDGPGGTLLEALLTASWKGGLVVLLVLAVQAMLGRRLPPRWRYALWLLVAVRLLMPVGPPSPLSLFRLAGSGSGSPLPAHGDPVATGGAASASTVSAGTTLDPAAALLGLWALGVLALAARALASDRRLRALLAGAEAVTDPGALELLDRCRERIGVRRRVQLVSSPVLSAPALWPGTPWPARIRGGAAILLPSGDWRRWTSEELRYVLLHELAHLRQGDGAARRLESLLAALHWLNPLVHLAARRAGADREPACDALVLSRLGGGERAGYGRALIRAAERVRTHWPVPGLVGMANHGHQLRRRITMIAHDRPRPRHRLVALAALVGALAAVCWTDLSAVAPAARSDAPTEPGDQERLKTTVQRQRDVGVAMIAWITDRIDGTCSDSDASAEMTDDDGNVDWSRCPLISHRELASLLVPAYLRELPDTDGWGHPFEFCLEVEDVCGGAFAAGLRSPGRDGSWQGDVYPVGPFLPDQVDRDVVWIDGFFVTWPEKADE